MSESKMDLVDELLMTLDERKFSRYLELLGELVSGHEQLSEDILKLAVLGPLQSMAKSFDPSNWWGKLAYCGTAIDAANLVAPCNKVLANQIKDDVDLWCENIPEQCEGNARPFIRLLVYQLDTAQHKRSLDGFDLFLGSFDDVVEMAKQPAWYNFSDFRDRLKELHSKSEIVFGELIESLTYRDAKAYSMTMDNLRKLSKEHKSRLSNAFNVLNHERILEEFDVSRFSSLPDQNNGILKALELRGLLDQKLFRINLSAESENEEHSNLNRKLISAFKELDGLLDEFFPECTWDKLEKAYSLNELRTSIGKWLTHQAKKSDCQILIKARTDVADWTGWDVAEERMLLDETCAEFMNEAQKSYDAALLQNAMRLLGDADKWQASSSKKWQERNLENWKKVGNHCGPVVPSSDNLEKWASWHLAYDVLGMIHDDPPDYKSTIRLLSGTKYCWGKYEREMTDLVEFLKTPSANGYLTENRSSVKNMHATMLAEIIGTLLDFADASKEDISRQLENLIKDDPNSVFKGLLRSYTHEVREIDLWHKLEMAKDMAEIKEIKEDLAVSGLADMEKLEKALDLAIAIIDVSLISISPDGLHDEETAELSPNAVNGATDEKAIDPLLVNAKKFFDSYSKLTTLLGMIKLPDSSTYQRVARNFMAQLCDHVESQWKVYAAAGNPAAIGVSKDKLDLAIKIYWTEHSDDSRISARKADNRRQYNKFWTDAAVRKYDSESKPHDAIEVALSKAKDDYQPDNTIKKILRRVVSAVSAGDLTTDELKGLLGLEIKWGEAALSIIADGCFRQDDKDLLIELEGIKDPLPNGYEQLLNWHRWRQKKDPNDSCLDVFAAMETGNIPAPLERAVSQFLTAYEDQPLLCLVWDVFEEKLTQESTQLPGVEAALKARDEALSNLEANLCEPERMHRVLNLDSIIEPYDASKVKKLENAGDTAYADFRTTLGTWEGRGGLKIAEMTKRIDELGRHIVFLKPHWKHMISMLSTGNPKKWADVLEEVRIYHLGAGAGSKLVIKTKDMLEHIRNRCRKSEERITWFSMWLDGLGGTDVRFHESIDNLYAGLKKDYDLLKGHSDAGGDLDGFIEDLKKASNTIQRWEKREVTLNDHRQDLLAYASKGGVRGEAETIIAWYDEMKKMARDREGIYEAWFDNWKVNRGGEVWVERYIPGLRKKVTEN